MEHSRLSTDWFPVHAIATHHYKTTAERLFDAWLDPIIIGQFMFGSTTREEEIVKLENQPYSGGAFTYSVKRKGIQLDRQGEYLEMDRPNRLVFTWSIRQDMTSHSRVVINIHQTEFGSDLALTHEMSEKWADFVNVSKKAWNRMLDKLEKVVTLSLI